MRPSLSASALMLLITLAGCAPRNRPSEISDLPGQEPVRVQAPQDPAVVKAVVRACRIAVEEEDKVRLLAVLRQDGPYRAIARDTALWLTAEHRLQRKFAACFPHVSLVSYPYNSAGMFAPPSNWLYPETDDGLAKADVRFDGDAAYLSSPTDNGLLIVTLHYIDGRWQIDFPGYDHDPPYRDEGFVGPLTSPYFGARAVDLFEAFIQSLDRGEFHKGSDAAQAFEIVFLERLHHLNATLSAAPLRPLPKPRVKADYRTPEATLQTLLHALKAEDEGRIRDTIAAPAGPKGGMPGRFADEFAAAWVAQHRLVRAFAQRFPDAPRSLQYRSEWYTDDAIKAWEQDLAEGKIVVQADHATFEGHSIFGECPTRLRKTAQGWKFDLAGTKLDEEMFGGDTGIGMMMLYQGMYAATAPDALRFADALDQERFRIPEAFLTAWGWRSKAATARVWTEYMLLEQAWFRKIEDNRMGKQPSPAPRKD